MDDKHLRLIWCCFVTVKLKGRVVVGMIRFSFVWECSLKVKVFMIDIAETVVDCAVHIVSAMLSNFCDDSQS